MRNIHILVTPNPSKLFKLAGDLHLHEEECIDPKRNQYVYITCDDATKISQWCFEVHNGPTLAPADSTKYVDEMGNIWWLREANCNDVAGCKTTKKIVFTNDPKLIKDGVQAIPDEFLEWLVKNPTTEHVEVKKDCCGQCDERLCEIYDLQREETKYNTFYQIIIPQEEPKLETLEEAAERFQENFKTTSEKPYAMIFKLGAKWQAERSYNEEEALALLHKMFMEQEYDDTLTVDEFFEKFKKK